MSNSSWETQSSPTLREKGHPEIDIWERAYSKRYATCSRYPQESDLWILSKKEFRMVFESDKFVLTKGWMYVGKLSC